MRWVDDAPVSIGNENHEKREKTEKVHFSVPKSRGVPKVVCLRGCVPKEQQGVKIRNFHHFCVPAKVLPWCERFSLLFAIFRDAPGGQYGNPWSEVPQGKNKRNKSHKIFKMHQRQKVALTP